MQEHEQALIAAIARLADTSDGEIGNNNNVCNLGIIFFFSSFQLCALMISIKGHYKHKRPQKKEKNANTNFAQSVASLLSCKIMNMGLLSWAFGLSASSLLQLWIDFFFSYMLQLNQMEIHQIRMTIQCHRDDGKAVCNINGVWLVCHQPKDSGCRNKNLCSSDKRRWEIDLVKSCFKIVISKM